MACDSPYDVEIKGRLELIPVPCGKCPPCRKRRIDDWVFRLQQEDKASHCSYFVTLTYDEFNVPVTTNNFKTLSKRDYQLFLKRLRDYQDVKIRYYLVGEYGSLTWRPHYHAIMFNVLDIENIEKAWGFGTVHVDKVNANTIAYCCKYIDKPKRIPQHSRDDRLKEFSAMSNGLGKSYIKPSTYKYHTDDITRLRVRKEDGNLIPMPRYYREMMYTDREKAEQRKHIVAQIEKQHELDRKYFNRLYNSEHIDYEKWCDSKRIGRFINYQRQVDKNRDYA